MKTIGEVVKIARVRKKYSIARLEEITKIKASFIEAIENENWSALPNFSTTLGFVKSIAGAVNVDEKTAVAVFKRDYPPKVQVINPKPDVGGKFVWSPKLTFGVGVGTIVVLILGYLGIQYMKFISPPELKIETPKEGEVVTGRYVAVSGVTDTDAKIIVNNQPVLVSPDGKFLVGLEIIPETHEIEIKAIGRSGKETIIKRNISVNSE